MPTQPLINFPRSIFRQTVSHIGLLLLVYAIIPCTRSLAEPAAPVFYESGVKAILAAKCTRCHNSDKNQAAFFRQETQAPVCYSR